ncbi:hypothetical protein TNCT_481531 [Trichonephila clavata]|uniref:Uncharacterized protein n=1 Tax=Trichonephila clavata TaxID=2740835 RepID=A0A8X6JCZ9_TRICU|nr:hypothetical protein TNCT_481531 [Trichonephila clavata]
MTRLSATTAGHRQKEYISSSNLPRTHALSPACIYLCESGIIRPCNILLHFQDPIGAPIADPCFHPVVCVLKGRLLLFALSGKRIYDDVFNNMFVQQY